MSLAIIATCFFFLRFLKYVPAAKPNLKNFSPLIFPIFTVPSYPIGSKIFFFHLFNKVLNTKRPCLTSSTLCTLKILIPCEKEKITDDKVPPILSFVSYFPEI